MSSALPYPLVLCIAGHDPGGGAGIVADLQACAAHKVHALSVITALTVQDSHNVQEAVAVPADFLRRQLDLLLADSPVQAIKIGLIGAADQVPVLIEVIERCGVPCVLDPVLRAGGGRNLADQALERAIRDELLPRVSLATPNAAEVRRLGGRQDTASAAAALIAGGDANLLVTGGDEPGSGVRNTWFASDGRQQHWDWPRLPETFHGAGCTLASAIAARLALGEPMAEALDRAQHWTQQTLHRAYAVGGGRRIPGRSESAS